MFSGIQSHNHLKTKFGINYKNIDNPNTTVVLDWMLAEGDMGWLPPTQSPGKVWDKGYQHLRGVPL